jgi:hypothetical protein
MKKVLRKNNLGKCIFVLVSVSSVFVFAGDVVVKDGEFSAETLKLTSGETYGLIIDPDTTEHSADRTLQIDLSNANRELRIYGDPTLDDNNLTSSGTPTFANAVVEGTRAQFRARYGDSDPNIRLFPSTTGLSLDLSANANYNGSQWNRDYTTKKGFLMSVTDDGAYYLKRAPSGSNPITWITTMVVDSTGIVTIPQAYTTGISGGKDLYVSSAGTIGIYSPPPPGMMENIRDLTGTERIYNLRPVLFDTKDGEVIDEAGLMAEEVEMVMPELVSYETEAVVKGTDEAGSPIIEYEQSGVPESVEYSKLILPMLKEIQKLKQENQALKDDIAKLKNAVGIE